MGCNCGKNRVATAVNPVRRVTVYQVVIGTTVDSEFSSLADARARAVEVSGRVKVTSKTE